MARRGRLRYTLAAKPAGPPQPGLQHGQAAPGDKESAPLHASAGGVVNAPENADAPAPPAPDRETTAPGEGASAMAQSRSAQDASTEPANYSLMEVAKYLDISPEMLRTWNRRFAALLGSPVAGDPPRYGAADVAVLRTVRTLLDEGYTDAEVQQNLTPHRIEPEPPPASLPNLARLNEGNPDDASSHALAVPSALGDMLGAIAGSQQTVLNSQASMREMVSVVVQDNFNLKDENRKLRDRMLELERGLAEYQRREETRKERLEARMRALEGTVSALQQQMSQFVQMQRAAQTKRRGWW